MAAPPRGSGGAWTDRRTEPGARGAVPPVGRGLVGGRESLTLILSLCWGATPTSPLAPGIWGAGGGGAGGRGGCGGTPCLPDLPLPAGIYPPHLRFTPHFPGRGDDKKLFSRSDLGGENFRVSGVGLPRGGVPEIIKWGCSSPPRPVTGNRKGKCGEEEGGAMLPHHPPTQKSSWDPPTQPLTPPPPAPSNSPGG